MQEKWQIWGKKKKKLKNEVAFDEFTGNSVYVLVQKQKA